MAKTKVKTKNGKTIFCVYKDKRHRKNNIEIESLSNKPLACLLPLAKIAEEGEDAVFVYDITGYLSLSEYLRAPLTKQGFLTLVGKCVAANKSIKGGNFQVKNLCLDLQEVMVRPTDDAVKFIYVPVQQYDNMTPFKNLLAEIGQIATFMPDVNKDFVNEYLQILTRNINYSEFDLDLYLDRHIKGVAPKKEGAQPPPVKKNEPTKADPMVYSGLGAPGSSAYLVREFTGDKIPVSANPFRIGRDPSRCDYVICGNKAVSGLHAVITTENGRSFITDQGSTNSTFLESAVINPHVKMELRTGMKITLADENLIFHTK